MIDQNHYLMKIRYFLYSTLFITNIKARKYTENEHGCSLLSLMRVK